MILINMFLLYHKSKEVMIIPLNAEITVLQSNATIECCTSSDNDAPVVRNNSREDPECFVQKR